MDKLPIELLSEIASHCDRPSQLQLRQVNKAWSDAAAPPVFGTFYIGWNPKHLQYLRKLAASNLATRLRCVVLNTEMLPLLSNLDWQRHLTNALLRLDDEMREKQEWKEKFKGKHFDILMREASTLLRLNEDPEGLHEALEALATDCGGYSVDHFPRFWKEVVMPAYLRLSPQTPDAVDVAHSSSSSTNSGINGCEGARSRQDQCSCGYGYHDEDWAKLFSLWPFARNPRNLLSRFSKATLDSNWSIFHERAVQQQQCGRQLAKLLRESIEKLPNVRHLRLVDPRSLTIWNSRRVGRDEPRVMACTPWSGLLLNPNEYLRDTGRYIWREGREEDDEENGIASSSYPVRLVLEELADSVASENLSSPSTKVKMTIEELTLHVGHYILLAEAFRNVQHTVVGRQAPSLGPMSRLPILLARLTTVNVAIDTNGIYCFNAMSIELAGCLTKATNMRRFVFNMRSTDPREFFKVLERLETSPWPSLEHLRYSGKVSTKQFPKVMSLISESLRELDLVDVQLYHIHELPAMNFPRPRPEMRWDDMLSSLRSVLDIDQAHLSNLGTDMYHSTDLVTFFPTGQEQPSDSQRWAEAYMTGVVDELPRQETWDLTAVSFKAWCGGCEIDEELTTFWRNVGLGLARAEDRERFPDFGGRSD